MRRLNMLKIKDSSSGLLKPLNDPEISIYNCGPTVYNDVHVGNIRPVITLDVLYRYLTLNKIPVKYVHNITDIDDKIINKAIETKQEELTLSEHYFQEYLKILNILNIKPMTVLPKVSDNINGIIEFVKQLIDHKKAYVVDGDVYFDLGQVNNYGIVSGQKKEQLLKGVRKEIDQKKHHPLDFVLWKKTDLGINWKTEWNNHGRPGWHTECVYLINKFIGKSVTIHGGGVDLKFPHHENENAQNLALNNLPLAKIWMHVGHINVNGEKMSKSLGNFTLAKDILKVHDANSVRWFFYQTKYQAPLNYSNDAIIQAKTDLIKIFKAINLALINYYWLSNNINVEINPLLLSNNFINAIEDDLNFPNMVQAIYEYTKELSSLIRNKDQNKLEFYLNSLVNMFNVLGLKWINILENAETLNLVKEWKIALNNKDYHSADQVRKQLQELDVIN
ncbi:MAG: cysteine--tRNA ligase [Mycoplasma sp.]